MIVEVTSGTITEKYLQATDITKIDSTSKVFFLEESEYQIPEILFGDGVIGKALANGDVVTVKYTTSSGNGANGLKVFENIGTYRDNLEMRSLLVLQLLQFRSQMEVQNQKLRNLSNLLLQNSILRSVEQFLRKIMRQSYLKSIQTSHQLHVMVEKKRNLPNLARYFWQSNQKMLINYHFLRKIPF